MTPACFNICATCMTYLWGYGLWLHDSAMVIAPDSANGWRSITGYWQIPARLPRKPLAALFPFGNGADRCQISAERRQRAFSRPYFPAGTFCPRRNHQRIIYGADWSCSVCAGFDCAWIHIAHGSAQNHSFEAYITGLYWFSFKMFNQSGLNIFIRESYETGICDFLFRKSHIRQRHQAVPSR